VSLIIHCSQDRIPKQAIFWEMSATSRGPGRPRKNWNDIICQDLKAVEWPGKMQNTPLPTKMHGVTVWPNMSFTQDKLK